MHPESSASHERRWWMLEFKPGHMEQATMPFVTQLVATRASELALPVSEVCQGRATLGASIPPGRRMEARVQVFPMVWQQFLPIRARFQPREKHSRATYTSSSY